jgi:histidyl-tRNA synthetase
MEFNFFGEKAIRKALPHLESPAIADLVAIGAALGERSKNLSYDPFLVRGMGYYTGTIFEIAHPTESYSLGGGGRYNGMIGRFLGTDVPAVGFSLGFERVVDLVAVERAADEATALLYEADVDPAALVAIQSTLIAEGSRVRLERRPKNLKVLLEQLAASGFSRYAVVDAAGLGAFKALGARD